MAVTTNLFASAIAGLPPAPVGLTRLLLGGEELRSTRSIAQSLAGDSLAEMSFLRLARTQLPGREPAGSVEAAEHLGVVRSTRLALVSVATHWLRSMLGTDPLGPPLLRHSIACAIAAEPLARDGGFMQATHALALGLLHHVGDAARLSSKRRVSVALDPSCRWELGGDLLQRAGAPASVIDALVAYGRFTLDPSLDLGPASRMLAAADHAVTAFGYATPAPCALPAVNAPIMDSVATLFESKRRICCSIEEVLGPILDVSIRAGGGFEVDPTVAPVSAHSPEELLEGVSARDLGPLPVIFARISGAQDAESIAVAGTAGLVEELGVNRAYYLQRSEDGTLRGGVLSVRGNVPLPLHDVSLHSSEIPRAMRMAFSTGCPIFHEGPVVGLESFGVASSSSTFFVPVIAGKEQLGVLGVEVSDRRALLPDLLATVAAHTALALKAIDLQRLSDEARIDELTGLYNRRGILDALERHIESISDADDLSIALFDCDHLKKVNDNFGHLMGDEFVRRISEVVKQTLRSSDEVGRIGGDEFLAVLPDAGLAHTRAAMERARANVERRGLESEDGLLLSISIGAVVRGRSGFGREKLLKLADFALYRAKEVGRNTVNVIDAENPPDLAM